MTAVLVARAPEASATEIRPILHPVAVSHIDDVHWTDTFGAPRSGGRTHLGVDILGPKMTPLVAAADGEVTWLRHDSSGNYLKITDDDGWSYFYVHINNDTPGTDDGANRYEEAFAEGIEKGVRVKAGQVVAFLGDSGNAESTAAHLHFEIARPDGTPINPTASVDAAGVAVELGSKLGAEGLGPYESVEALVEDVLITLTPTAEREDLEELADRVAQTGLADALAPYISGDSRAADIDRLYVAFFDRLPDLGGYEYWIDRDDLDLAHMADFFADSDEFRTQYEGLDFGDFLDLLYVNVLGREPDASGKAYWLGRLDDPDDPVTRGTIVSYFTDSPELRGLTRERSEIVALTALIEDRMPNADDVDAWIAIRADHDLSEAVEIYLAN